MLCRGGHDGSTDGAAPREGNHVHVRVIDERLPQGGTALTRHVVHRRREVRLPHAEIATRWAATIAENCVAGLTTRRAAGGERAGRHAGDQSEREVPRCDNANHSPSLIEVAIRFAGHEAESCPAAR